jgi:Domain of unknown function (DUF6883)
MTWPPRIGEPLPRAAEAWCSEGKWVDWILAERGHGSEWSRVFHVRPDRWERVWEALATAAIGALIQTIRGTAPGGITCGVAIELTIEGRTATVTSAWHYEQEGAAPRLVSAYPKPYNRGHGDGA